MKRETCLRAMRFCDTSTRLACWHHLCEGVAFQLQAAASRGAALGHDKLRDRLELFLSVSSPVIWLPDVDHGMRWREASSRGRVESSFALSLAC
jgi:hypothetical protein